MSALVFIAVFGFLDYISGPYISFQVFYLIPVAAVTWFLGKRLSTIPLAASTIAWLFNDILDSHSYIHPLIPYWNIFVKIVFFGVIIFIMSELKRMLDREKLFARIDYLTETANKRYFYELALREVSRSNRYKRPITLAYIDVDNLKSINDRFGHDSGDDALRQAAQALKEGVRGSDTVARVGGDEFVILFPETDYQGAEVVIRRIKKGLSGVTQNNTWSTTLSIGVVTCENYPCDLESIITNADRLMYSAKMSGRGMVNHDLLG